MPMKQITLRVSEDFFKAVRIRAIEESITVNELGTKALADYLNKKPGK